MKVSHRPTWTLSHTLQEVKQELSYRKQIARQLRTQYVSDIYKPNYRVTLKSRLRSLKVTENETIW